MNPDVARAIPELAASGALPADKAPLLLRVARGELLSVHGELRALLYAGVLLITGGVGLLVKENLDRIGPVAIAVGIGLAAAALAWVIAKAPPFSWGPVTSPHLAFDYILLLGVLLTGAELAYVEWKFTPLGAHWPWHLLIMALLAGVAAFRFDSRVIFSLSLSTFAAWRGVSVALLGSGLWNGSGDAVRWNAIACGVLFAVLGFGLARSGRKAHFEPVAVHLGWLLVLGGIGSGIAESGDSALRWGVALLLVGTGLAAGAFQARRFPLFAYGVLAGYVGLSRVVIGITKAEILGCFWFSITSIFLIIGLLIAQRRMREPV